MPIVCTTTYSFSSTKEIRDHFDGVIDREEYGRYGNPTVRAAEDKLAALEGAEEAVLFPTSMSAVTTLLLAMLKPGDHVVMISEHRAIKRVFYPGLPSHPDHEAAARQFSGFGGMVSCSPPSRGLRLGSETTSFAFRWAWRIPPIS